MNVVKNVIVVGSVAAGFALVGPGMSLAAAAMPAQTVVNQPSAPSSTPPKEPTCGPFQDAPHWDFDAPSNPLGDWCTQWQGQPRDTTKDGGGGTVFMK
ncbi:hypothetical protein I1A62_27980 [Rhodococcus sp. USK10]|uniref:hypothetical protein n=1 Tax=Rhodococcus sp. USK10 TaxID=2789739 RepID=UPI001C5D452F|nr:hypothetical protein [Rhodococcus sp. USK10]QYB01105.1 hypothetical protein I1A62_27980 [Rhodococcus sp. USK10]